MFYTINCIWIRYQCKIVSVKLTRLRNVCSRLKHFSVVAFTLQDKQFPSSPRSLAVAGEMNGPVCSCFNFSPVWLCYSPYSAFYSCYERFQVIPTTCAWLMEVHLWWDPKCTGEWLAQRKYAGRSTNTWAKAKWASSPQPFGVTHCHSQLGCSGQNKISACTWACTGARRGEVSSWGQRTVFKEYGFEHRS